MKSISDALTFVRLRVLLEGGTRTWEDNISPDQLKGETEDNDIYGKIYMQGHIGFVEVNSDETPISDFYTYEEVKEKDLDVSDNALLWRTFRVLIDDNMSLPSDLPDHDIFKSLIRSHLNIV